METLRRHRLMVVYFEMLHSGSGKDSEKSWKMQERNVTLKNMV